MTVSPAGPLDSKILIVGSVPGKIDAQISKPYGGQPGRLLDQLLSQADISRYSCRITFACKERPPGGSAKFFFTDKKMEVPNQYMQTYLDQLKEEIETQQPNVIIALGSTALWALCGTNNLKNFRGSLMECTLVPGIKVIPTHSPESINAKWDLTFVTSMDLRKAAKHALYEGFPEDKRVIIEDATLQEFIDYCDFLINDPSVTKIGADIETCPPNAHITRIGFAHSRDYGLSFPFLKGHMPLHPESGELKAWSKLCEVLTCPKLKIWQNGTYDLLVLWKNNGIIGFDLDDIVRDTADTLTAAHVCWPEAPRDLGFLTSLCLDVQAWKQDNKDYHGKYNAQDAMNTLGIWEVLDKEMDYLGVRQTYEMELRQYPVAMMLQMRGIKVNEEVRARLVIEQNQRLEDAKTALDKAADHAVNFNSPKQLIQLLYVERGLQPQYARRKTITEARKMTTNEDALNHLASISIDPVLMLVLECRKSYKLLGVIQAECSPDGLHHTCYNVCRTDTGRWSSSGSIIFPFGSGNLQNITYYIREMYESPIPNRVIIQADYIQAEAVDVAFRTNDQKLKGIFDREEDLHAHTAADMGLASHWTEVDPDGDARRKGKTLRHASNYSAGPKVVQVKLGVKLADAKKLLDIYMSIQPKLVYWQGQVREKLNVDRTLVNAFGRKRKFLGRLDDNLYRSAYAFQPQSDIGDLMNMSITKMYEQYGDVLDLLLQLHDAMYIDTPDDHDSVLFAMQKMGETMYREVPLNGDTMIVKVDYSIGTSWGGHVKARIQYEDGASWIEIQVKIDGAKTWKRYDRSLL